MRTKLAVVTLVLISALALAGVDGPNERSLGKSRLVGPNYWDSFTAEVASIYATATACWSFNDPTDLGNDDCTNTYDLTLVNTPTATGGALGYAMATLAASSQYAWVVDSAATSLDGDKTFSAWFVRDTAGANMALFSQRTSGNGAYQCSVDVANNVGCYITDSNDASFSEPAVGAVTVGQRYLVHFWYDTSDKKAYIQVNDGAPSAGAALPNGPISSSQDFNVGRLAGSIYGDGVRGPIMIHSEVLSSADKTSLYNSGKGKTCADLSGAELTNLVSCWDMDEDGGPYADSIGSNNLTAVNTPTRAAGLVERSDSGMAVSVVGGSDQYLNVAGFNPTTTGGYTLAQWFSLSELLDGHGAGIPNQFLFYNDYTNALIYDDGFILPSCSGGNPDDGDWHLAIMWVDTSTGKGYCTIDDGTSAGTALTGSYVAVNGTFSVGKVNSSPSSSAIDNTAFWPRPLTSDERATLYNSGAGTYYASAWGDMIHNGPYYASADPIMLQPLRYPPPSSRRFYVR